MQSKARTVAEYIRNLPPEQRKIFSAVRKVILKNLPKGYKEIMDFGMVCYVIPLQRFPDTYNSHPLPILAFGVQKNYLSLYMMCVYGETATRKWFEAGFKKSGKKLNMGKSCVRFKTLNDLPLDLIGQAVARVSVDQYLEFYKKARERQNPKSQARNPKKRQTAKRKL